MLNLLQISSENPNIPFNRYASLLAGQGCLSSALLYLGETAGTDPALQELKDRLERALAGPPAAQAGRVNQAGRAGSSVPAAVPVSSFRRQSFQVLNFAFCFFINSKNVTIAMTSVVDPNH